MDMDALIDEICRRVLQKAAVLEEGDLDVPEEKQEKNDPRPGLLILTSEHGTECHRMLEHEKLLEKYQTRCALLSEYQCPVSDCEAVIACSLTNEALGKIAHGIFDSGYTRMFGEALLSGKKIYVPEEEIELYRYRETAPKPFYGSLEANLELLKSSGVLVVPFAAIPELIFRENGEEPEKHEQSCGQTECARKPEKETGCEEATGKVKEAALLKKIITERDMAALGNEKVQSVIVSEKAILTDLAKEYAARHKMSIRRQEISSGKKEQKL